MNIKQAKRKFTELTGHPATKDGSLTYIPDVPHTYIISYISEHTPFERGSKAHDRRRTRYWVLLVQAIRSYRGDM